MVECHEALFYCDITDVLWLFPIESVLLMIYQPGAQLAPLGEKYLQNTDVLWLFPIESVLLMIYQPGAQLAPLGEKYLQNSKWLPMITRKYDFHP